MAERALPESLVDTYQLYIDGRCVEPENGRYDDVSPSTGMVIATAPDASVSQVGDAVDAARRAFDAGPWPAMSHQERGHCLAQLGAALQDYADAYFALSQVEWGCTANERRLQIDASASAARRAGHLAGTLGDQSIQSASGAAVLCHEPLGVVSILTPWNFPHSLNVMKLSRALAGGNTVVLKPSPLTPLAGLALARIIHEHTDIPPGVVNVVTPGGIEASIVLDDAECSDELLARMLFESCLLHAGQACILHSRLLLPEAMHDEIVDRLVALARAVRVGDPADPDVQMGPLISAAQRSRVEDHVARALRDGATLAAGGRRPATPEAGFYYEPTILTGVTPDAHIAQNEVFGPVLSVLRYRDDDDAVAIANNSQYGLSGAVWGGDADRAVRVARRIRTGQIAVNGFGPGDAPFGGFKQSGLGREGGGIAGLHQYMEPKAIGMPG